MPSTRTSCGRAVLAAVAIVALTGMAEGLPINGRVRVHTFTVGPAGTVSPDPTIGQDFQYANLIFNQVGIRFENTGNTFVLANTPATAGQWTSYQVNSTLNTAGRQQPQGFAYFIVPGQSYANGSSTLAQTWSQEDVGSTVTDPNNMANTTTVSVRTIATRGTRGGTDTVPHEFGHMLSNRYRWRNFDAAATNNLVHSGTVTDLMTPTVQNPAANQVWPDGNQTQIRHNIGRYNGASAGRVPLITTLYNDGNIGGLPAGNAMFSEVNRDSFQYSLNQNNSTVVRSPTWGSSDLINMPTMPSGSHSYFVDETARRAQNQTETFSFFITSPVGWNSINDLGQGWGFSALGIDSLDGMYSSLVSDSIQVRVWSDILFGGPVFTDANGGAGVLVDAARYSASGGVTGGGIFLNLNFTASDAQAVLAGLRDMQITFTANIIPAPAGVALLGIAGLLALRRRR